METYSIQLRTLTKKSVLWFGKYNGVSVQQLLDLSRHTYLRWVYYNIKGISFMDDILETITVRGERRIEKPGSDPEMYYKTLQENTEKLSMKVKSHLTKKMRIQKAVIENKITRRSIQKKSVLTANNHGHYKWG